MSNYLARITPNNEVQFIEIEVKHDFSVEQAIKAILNVDNFDELTLDLISKTLGKPSRLTPKPKYCLAESSQLDRTEPVNNLASLIYGYKSHGYKVYGDAVLYIDIGLPIGMPKSSLYFLNDDNLKQLLPVFANWKGETISCMKTRLYSMG
jgi:hypothetical protein